VQASHVWRGDSAVFDEDNLVSHAGLVPLLELAEQAGLSRLLDEQFGSPVSGSSPGRSIGCFVAD
jgi:hypothetical protein